MPIIAASSLGNMTFLVTEFDRPFTAEGFGNWFRERCIEAGVPGRAHGLRKAGATIVDPRRRDRVAIDEAGMLAGEQNADEEARPLGAHGPLVIEIFEVAACEIDGRA